MRNAEYKGQNIGVVLDAVVFMSRTKLHNLLIKQAWAFLLAILPAFFINDISAAAPVSSPIHKTAIFIENRAGNAFNDKVPVLEDFITSRVTEHGFSVLSREALINAFKDYSTGSGASGSKAPDVRLEQQLGDDVYALKMMQAIGEMFFGAFKGAPTEEPKAPVQETAPANLDQQLSRNSSALRLAQMMGADYIIAASVTSFGIEKKSFESYGVKTVNLIHNLRVSYKILETVQGGSLVADTVKVSKTIRFTEGSYTESSDIINELLDEASVKVAESLRKKRITPPSPKPDLVEITIACGMQDLAQLPISIPDIQLTKDNTVVIGENNLEVQLLDAAVEINGTAIGSAPGTFKALPGLSKIRLSREGFRDWERTINVMAGQKLKVALQMSDAGYARWKDNTAFLQGAAQMLQQSGYKVDVKADVKVDEKGGLFSIFKLFR